MPNDSPGVEEEGPGLERRLATIMMADVAGYSRMMGENEERTVQMLQGHRQVFDALLKMHRGRVFSTAGDAILAEFPSAVEAVRCATEIQSALRTRNEKYPEDQRMWFRIGINLGDVIVQEGDLLGDGVNVAARIQTIAEPGGICISGSVYDQIQNKLTLQFRGMGERSFKNIAQPVRTFSIAEADGAAMPVTTSIPTRKNKVKGFAVIFTCLLGLLTVGGAGYWLYSNYEINKEDRFSEKSEIERKVLETGVDKKDSLAKGSGARETERRPLEKEAGGFVPKAMENEVGKIENHAIVNGGRNAEIKAMGREAGETVPPVIESEVFKVETQSAESGVWEDERRLDESVAKEIEQKAAEIKASIIEQDKLDMVDLSGTWLATFIEYDVTGHFLWEISSNGKGRWKVKQTLLEIIYPGKKKLDTPVEIYGLVLTKTRPGEVAYELDLGEANSDIYVNFRQSGTGTYDSSNIFLKGKHEFVGRNITPHLIEYHAVREE